MVPINHHSMDRYSPFYVGSWALNVVRLQTIDFFYQPDDALLLQIFVTNRIIRRFGVKAVNLIFPATSLISFAALLMAFGLPGAILGSFNIIAGELDR